MFKNFIRENLKNVLISCACCSVIIFCLWGVVYFQIKVDESKLDKTRYCSSCGADLIK